MLKGTPLSTICHLLSFLSSCKLSSYINVSSITGRTMKIGRGQICGRGHIWPSSITNIPAQYSLSSSSSWPAHKVDLHLNHFLLKLRCVFLLQLRRAVTGGPSGCGKICGHAHILPSSILSVSVHSPSVKSMLNFGWEMSTFQKRARPTMSKLNILIAASIWGARNT